MASNTSHPSDSRVQKPPTAPKPSAALQGAAIAFGKPPVKPKPTSTFNGQNAALAAASKADKDSASASASRAVSAHHTGTITDDMVEGGLIQGYTGRGAAFGAGLEPELVRSRLNDLTTDKKPRTLQASLREKSQSHIAANLAASRSASISPNRKTDAGQQRRTLYEEEAQSNIGSRAFNGEINNHLRALPLETMDNTSIPSTSSLIGAFEQFSSPFAKSYTMPVDAVLSSSTSQSKHTSSKFQPTPMGSAYDPQRPKPEYMLENPVSSPPSPKTRKMLSTSVKSAQKPKMKLGRPDTGTSLDDSTTAETILPNPHTAPPSPKPKSTRVKNSFGLLKPSPKPMVGNLAVNPLTPKLDPPEASGVNKPSPSLTKEAPGKYPNNPPAKVPPSTEDVEDASSDDSFVSASDGLPSQPKPSKPNPNTKPGPIPPRQRPQLPLTLTRNSISASQNNMSVNSLADAMVASALASSRGSSPSTRLKPQAPAPPPSRRSTPSLFLNAQAHLSQSSRTPSPSKSSLHKHHTGGKSGMRSTMRKTPRSSEDEDVSMAKRGRKNLMKKHPNKHHEGDRKRWRDVVSDRERKRYEGLWASNKGLFTTPATSSNESLDIRRLSPQRNSSTTSLSLKPPTYPRPPLEDCVSNLVVRDIWSRSRLPADVLSDIWGLVDRSEIGMLSREEFVAGTWLVDQRLKGRKLPQRVGDSVWSSLGALGGVKVKDKHGKAIGGNGNVSNSGSGR